MQRTLLGGKIHRATVTQADLHYVGSITIDKVLMDAADLVEGEQVQVVDIDNGARLVTYVIEGPAGSGVIGINGAAARLISVGDLVIIMSFRQVEESERASWAPRVAHVNERNELVAIGADPSEPVPGADDQVSSKVLVH
ncbi:aspartate 1-decarboxylase [Actinoplanes sp. N902-109]|uniref:aspartate 1-decarboxylase n=1 Tax=Actinoplanes sp. (strain N902-109) TaxID=649831 RepID=UPI0003295322|nr:aspartate 1-decarboxylase [Actinoplanes sp. N902-109]AGL15085.1 aspartate 1-decarboxylase [Actinoplanes sp. N902-109]